MATYKKIITNILLASLCSNLTAMNIGSLDAELLYAVTKDNISQVLDVIGNGANANAKTIGGDTALQLAVLNGSLNLVSLLIKHGADINAKNTSGASPLHLASNESIVKLLIDKGANVNAQDFSGHTPMHWAALNGYKDIVILLLINGADKNIKNDKNETVIDEINNQQEQDIEDATDNLTIIDIINNHMQITKR